MAYPVHISNTMSSPTVRDIVDERVTAFDESTTVADAIDVIRTSTTESSHTVYYAYVLDADRKVTGVASLRELLNAEDGMELGEVGSSQVVTIEISTSIQDCVDHFTTHEYTMLPVVTAENALVGTVHSNTIIEVLNDRWSKKVLKSTVQDIEYDPGDERAFDCVDCGTIVTAADNPGECPTCAETLENRTLPIE